MKTLTSKQMLILLLIWFVLLIGLAFHPHDQLTFWMESAPVVIAPIILFYTYKNFPLPRFILLWIFIHGIVLMIGGHYTYAKEPFGFWLQDILNFSRNPYDRIGHILQGFVPALIAREILVRKVGIQKKSWVFFLTVTVCMSISVLYEFIEWWAALLLGQSADAFLGTQGDQWDTQWDMFLATLGAIASQLIYKRETK